MLHPVEPVLLGLEVNSSRVQALVGTPTGPVQVLALSAKSTDLPLAINLAQPRYEVGHAGLALCRRSPHLACTNFLTHLGEKKRWGTGQHSVDALHALVLTLSQVQRAYPDSSGVGLALPGYLRSTQLDYVLAAARQSGLRVQGTMPSPLAAALTAFAEQPWSGPALLLDADEHAFTLAALLPAHGSMRVLDTHYALPIRLGIWKQTLLDLLAERCIRLTRRDPRDVAEVEQQLFEQLDGLVLASLQRRPCEIVLDHIDWFQRLTIAPEEVAHACRPLALQVVQAIETHIQQLTAGHGPPTLLLLTETTALLPGLVEMLQEQYEVRHEPTSLPGSDFGAGLLQQHKLTLPVHMLAAEATLVGVHDLACQCWSGDLPTGHVEMVALPLPQPVDAGPARLQFQGQDYPLGQQTFRLGRHPDCELSFASVHYPSISTHHCELLFDSKGYFLRDYSRNGTLVNHRRVTSEVLLRPGDWIRLGCDGPVLRFLGQGVSERKRVTTA